MNNVCWYTTHPGNEDNGISNNVSIVISTEHMTPYTDTPTPIPLHRYPYTDTPTPIPLHRYPNFY